MALVNRIFVVKLSGEDVDQLLAVLHELDPDTTIGALRAHNPLVVEFADELAQYVDALDKKIAEVQAREDA